MINNDNVYLPTDKFYSIPKYEGYTQAKNEHLQRLGEAYPTDDAKAKWPLLMEAFADALQEDDKPNLELPEFKARLAEFKSKRESTSTSDHTLSLEQCVNYFKEFYFLYTTTDPRYKLTPAAKKTLLIAITEAIGACETGINGRFCTALQDHKKDSDWIQDQLSKARSQTLHQLNQLYIATQQSLADESVLTYSRLVTLANQENLGILITEEITDIFAIANSIETFFHKHYPTLFEAYEKQVIDNLTNHYLSELASTLDIDSAEWGAGELTIPSTKTINLQKSIEGHFKDIDITGVVDSLGELSEGDTKFTLKTKQTVAEAIKRLVTEKLLVDQYYVSLDAVADNREAHQNIRIKKDVALDDLIQAHQAFKQNNTQDIHDVLSQNTPILMHYPELVLSHIKSNPAFLSSLPLWLKADTRFLDATMVTLNEMLCEAVTANNAEEINNLTSQALNLIQSETGYALALSESVRTHPLVANRLLKRNNTHFDWQKNIIETHEFIAHIDNIAPSFLLETIESRRQNNLQPLPFFDNDKAIHNLKQFSRDLENQLSPDWSQPYLSIRRRACEQENFASMRDPYYKKNAVTFLSKTNTWFAGFNQYRAYQTSSEKLWLELVPAVIACYELIWSMIKICAFDWAIVNLIPLYTQFIQPFFWPIILGGCALLLINHFLIGSRFLATVSQITLTIALLNLELYLRIIGEVFRCVYNAFVAVTAILPVLNTCLNMIFTMLPPLWQNTYVNNTLENTCENILIRLDGIDEVSAQEKSDVLRTLLSYVKADVSEEAGHSFEELLAHKYSIIHQGDTHEVSFSDVSSMRRPYYGGFKLEQPSSCMRFFSGRTTSEAFMETAEAPLAGL